MFSGLIQLAGFGLLSYGVGIEAGTGWGIITGGLAVVFIGHFVDDRAATRSLGRATSRGKRLIMRLRKVDNGAGDGSTSSPHPPIIVSPELEKMSRQLAEKRVKRGDGRMPNRL